jgi:hypothetical protein
MRKIGFGADVYIYLRRELTSGYAIANALLKLPLEKGSMLGYFPDEVNSPDDFSPQLSIFLTTGINIGSELQASIIALMAQYLEKDERNCIILETLLETSFPYVKSLDVPYFSYESNIYLTISHQDSAIKNIERAKGIAGSYPFVCMLISLPENLTLEPKSEISTVTLETMTKSPDYIFVGAYDDEGCVIWESPQAKYQISL